MNLPIHQPTMTSLQIAEITDKQHKSILRSIRKMEEAWQKVTGRNFGLSEYTDATGRVLPCYNLTKEECLYIATKFNDEARARLILRWMELERKQAEWSPESLSETFRRTRGIAESLKEELANSKVLPAVNEPLNNNDIAIYCYLRNGIKSASDAPFCVTIGMVSKTLGIDTTDVESSFEKLAKGGYIATRKDCDMTVFVLGNVQP